MIEIIKEQIRMPLENRRFQTICENNKWKAIDTQSENKIVFKGSFEDVVIACHNLNKKYYRDFYV